MIVPLSGGGLFSGIALALRHAFLPERLILEGGAALPIAALLNDASAFAGQTVVLILTGQNIDMALFSELMISSK